MNHLLLLLAILFTQSALAQSSVRFSISRNAVAGGGVTLSASSRFQLASTIAQPLAAVWHRKLTFCRSDESMHPH